MRDESYLATHEASHAVVQWLRGCKLHLTTITGPDRRGTPCYALATYPRDHRNVEDGTDIASSFLAPAALFGIGALGCENDTFEAMLHLTGGTVEARAMSRVAADLLDKYPDSWEAAARAFFEKFGYVARDLIESEPAKKAINRLAGLLAERGSLSGYEVASFLESNWPGPLPERVIPAGEHSLSLDLKKSSDSDNLMAAKRLLKMSFETIPLTDETEPAREALLNAIFQISEVKL
ncbi:MAG: hypothetical protein WA081_05430 [Desulfosalsimonadaceae bacterium]